MLIYQLGGNVWTSQVIEILLNLKLRFLRILCDSVLNTFLRCMRQTLWIYSLSQVNLNLKLRIFLQLLCELGMIPTNQVLDLEVVKHLQLFEKTSNFLTKLKLDPGSAYILRHLTTLGKSWLFFYFSIIQSIRSF